MAGGLPANPIMRQGGGATTAGYVDVWCNIFTPDGIRKYFLEQDNIRFAFELFHRTHHLKGYELDEFLGILDEAGFEKVCIPSFKVKAYRGPIVQDCPLEEVASLVERAPDRIIGLVGINCYNDIMGAVREIEHGVREYGFRGAHIHPYGFGYPLNHAIYYPVYAKCCELNIPVFMQVGHSAERMPSDVGHPILLDQIALDFPDLKIVGMHTGWPWTEVLIAMAWKHPNIYIGTSAHAPKYWDRSLVSFINSRGQDKVLFGSDYPVLLHKECVDQIGTLGLRPEAHRKLMRENAMRVLGLSERRG